MNKKRTSEGGKKRMRFEIASTEITREISG